MEQILKLYGTTAEKEKSKSENSDCSKDALVE